MTLRVVLLVPLVALAVLVGLSGTGLAHEHVKVADGKYELSVGWRTEPPYAGLKNGLDLGVHRLGAASTPHEHDHEGGAGAHSDEKTPVKGLLGNLTVTYEIAGKTFTPPEWREQFDRPGWYTAEITPTREGTYTVHIVGTIEGHAVDARVKPHAVEAYSTTMFPEPDLTPEEASEKLADLEKTVAALQREVASLKTNAQGENPTPTEVQNKRTPALGVALAALAVAAAAAVAGKRK